MMHRHQWFEQRRVYSRPLGEFEVERSTQDLIEKMTFGITTIEDRCSKCNQVRITTANGDLR